MNTLYEISADEKARAVYEYRLKAQRDAQWIRDSAIETAVENARDKGMQEGMQEGMQKGMQKGIQEGMQKTLDLLKSGISPDEIIRRFNQ